MKSFEKGDLSDFDKGLGRLLLEMIKFQLLQNWETCGQETNIFRRTKIEQCNKFQSPLFQNFTDFTTALNLIYKQNSRNMQYSVLNYEHFKLRTLSATSKWQSEIENNTETGVGHTLTPFHFKWFHYVNDHGWNKDVNSKQGTAIVISNYPLNSD